VTEAPTTAEKEPLASPEPSEPPTEVVDGSGSGRHPALEATAGFDYGALIIETLSEERDRKKSLEQRGLAVVTTSGALVSLLFAIGAVVTSAESFHVPGVARTLLAVGVGLFAAAAVAGIRTNRPLEYAEPGAGDLLQLTEEKYWEAERGPSAVALGSFEPRRCSTIGG